MSIALANSVGSFFHEVVGEAVRSRQIEATEHATSYLVALLTDFAHPDAAHEDTFDRPLTFLLDEAFHATGADRFQRLRALGDSTLYITGFFGEHIENRGVNPSYVANVGATAYEGAAAMLRGRSSRAGGDPFRSAADDDNVFRELAQKFDRFVEVLTEVAETTLAHQARGERGILKLYERWQKSGSSTLAKELGARGIIPVHGSGGVH